MIAPEPMRDDSATAVVSARGAARIRSGHPWVFRPDVISGPARGASDGGPALVTVEAGRGKALGIATWAARARLALGMIGRAAAARPRPLAEIVDERLGVALARRLALA